MPLDIRKALRSAMGRAGAVVPISAGLASPRHALAQTEVSAAPSFDVASLKPVQPSPPYPVDLGNTLHGKVTLTNVTLTECLRFAFKINNDGQIAGPIGSRPGMYCSPSWARLRPRHPKTSSA